LQEIRRLYHQALTEEEKSGDKSKKLAKLEAEDPDKSPKQASPGARPKRS
jgi:hypothetical protein